MPGGLCCYCHVPRGITLRCGVPECCESFHFMCHWRNGGYCELRDADIYIGGGKHPCLFALCFKHMPAARRAALPAEVLLRASMQGFSRGNPGTLREVLQRLDGAGKTAGKTAGKPSSAANSMGKPTGIPAGRPSSTVKSTASSAGIPAVKSSSVGRGVSLGGRFGYPREICHVCGFGFAAPPINQEMVLEGSRLGRCVNIRKEETPSAVHPVHSAHATHSTHATHATHSTHAGNASNASNASTSSPSFPSSSASASASASASNPSNRKNSKPRGGDPSKRGIVDHIAEKLETAGQRVDCGSGVYLQPGTRGNMLHCVVCGTVVHEVCADLPRIQVLAQFDHVKCIHP